MRVSFAITVHDEGDYLSKLFPHLEEHMKPQDEVVVLDDFSTDPVTVALLDVAKTVDGIRVYQHELNRDFAAHKNYLNSLCAGDYIFQIDADEMPTVRLLRYLHDLLEMNSGIELVLVPRVNIVEGITTEYIRSWGVTVNEQGWIQWPDYQTRIYKNDPSRIKWVGKVHERITGFNENAKDELPAYVDCCLLHYKTFERQMRQNALYASIAADVSN